MKKLLLVFMVILLSACSTGKAEETKVIDASVDDIIEGYENYAGQYEDAPEFAQVYESEGFYYMGDFEFMIHVNENNDVEFYSLQTEKPNKDVLDLMRNISGMELTQEYKEIKRDIDSWENKEMPKNGFFSTFESNNVKMYVTYYKDKFQVSINPI